MARSSTRKRAGFSKGHSKVGGRSAGTPNKDAEKVADIFRKLRFDPFEVMVAFATNDRKKLKLKKDDPVIPYEIRSRMASECAKYIKPQLKGIQVQDEDGHDLVAMFAAAVAGKET